MTVYAFCLGVNTYKAPIDNLKCAERDARDLTALLRERFGFIAEYLEERITEHIENRIEELETRLLPGDTFLFYFSGHGKSHNGDQYFLLPGCRYNSLEAGQAVTGGVLSWKALKRLTSGPAWRHVHRIFIFDACRTHLIANKGAGEFPVFDGAYLLRDAAFSGPKAVTEESPVTLINSCDEGKYAVELPVIGNSVFMLALMDSLKSTGRKGDVIVVDQDFMTGMGERMAAHSAAAGLPELNQAPVWRGEVARLPLHGDGGAAWQHQLTAQERDERMWRIACAKDMVEAYEYYIHNAPRGAAHIEEAQRCLNQAVEKQLATERRRQGESLIREARVTGNPALFRRILELHFEEYRDEAETFLHALKIADDDAAWLRADQAGDEAGYRDYLERFAEGRHVRQAATALDAIAAAAQAKLEAEEWERVRNGSLDDLRGFIRRWPEGQYVEHARSAIERLALASAIDADRACWTQFDPQVMGDMEAYLARYPQGLHAKQASEIIAGLRAKEVASAEEERLRARDDAAWAEASRSSSEAAYHYYLNYFPEGRHVNQALAALEAIQAARREQREAEEWERAKLGGREDVLAYIRRWPSGAYIAEAHKAIERLALEAAIQADRACWAGCDPLVLSDMQDYLKQFPEGLHAREAREAVEALCSKEAREAENEELRASQRAALFRDDVRWENAAKDNNLDRLQDLARQLETDKYRVLLAAKIGNLKRADARARSGGLMGVLRRASTGEIGFGRGVAIFLGTFILFFISDQVHDGASYGVRILFGGLFTLLFGLVTVRILFAVGRTMKDKENPFLYRLARLLGLILLMLLTIAGTKNMLRVFPGSPFDPQAPSTFESRPVPVLPGSSASSET